MVSENLILVGILVILIGFVLVFIGSLIKAKSSKTEFGFVGFIGPIPVGFGTSKEIIIFALIVGLIIFLISIISFVR